MSQIKITNMKFVAILRYANLQEYLKNFFLMGYFKEIGLKIVAKTNVLNQHKITQKSGEFF